MVAGSEERPEDRSFGRYPPFYVRYYSGIGGGCWVLTLVFTLSGLFFLRLLLFRSSVQSHRRGLAEEPPRVERALRGGCASFFFLLVVLVLLRSSCAPCLRLCLTLYLLRHFYYLDRAGQDLGCKSRNFQAALTLGACLPLRRSMGMHCSRKTLSQIVSCFRITSRTRLCLGRPLIILTVLYRRTDKFATRSTWLPQSGVFNDTNMEPHCSHSEIWIFRACCFHQSLVLCLHVA